MSQSTTFLSESIIEYVHRRGLHEPPLLRALREETAALPEASMQISPEQGQLMAMLVQLLGARKCLEVGTFTGYSSISVARVLPADGKLIACDVSKEWTDKAQQYWHMAGVADRIELRLGPAMDTLDALLADEQADSFDFAFIDADKSHYEGYYERVLRLLRNGGLAVVDNTLWSGRVLDPDHHGATARMIDAFNARLHDDDRIDLVMLPISDGVTLARKR